MAAVFYDLTRPDSGMNYRWVQPPQVAYFVTTMDAVGNVNSAPVTLGTCVSVDMEPGARGNYYFTFALGCTDLPIAPARQSWQNLHEVPECVISYIGACHFRQAQIASLPLPRGISEIDAMGLAELPSRHVGPPGIRECGVNLEAKVLSSTKIGQYYELFLCQVVGVSVDEALVARDRDSDLHAGIVEIDPLFEVTALRSQQGTARIHTVRLDRQSVQRLPDDVGPSRSFVGSFHDWLEDEVSRGTLSKEGQERILELAELWKANPNPESNAEVKRELTEAVKALIPRES